MINYKIVEFEKELINHINSSNINIASVYLILDKLTKEVKLALNEVVEKEQQEMHAQHQETEEIVDVEAKDLMDIE